MSSMPSFREQSAQLDDVLGRMVVTDAKAQPFEFDEGVEACVAQLEALRGRSGQLFVIGNGGSAGVAGHAVIDFLNVAKLRATTLHDAPMLTCLSNDYGYENSYARALEVWAKPGDLLIAISSSGQSANMTNAVETVRRAGTEVMTLSGFREDNPLRQGGDLNIWLPSSHYGMVEIGHQFVLHHLSERLALKPISQEQE